MGGMLTAGTYDVVGIKDLMSNEIGAVGGGVTQTASNMTWAMSGLAAAAAVVTIEVPPAAAACATVSAVLAVTAAALGALGA